MADFKPEELIIKTVGNTVQFEAKHEEKTSDGHSFTSRYMFFHFSQKKSHPFLNLLICSVDWHYQRILTKLNCVLQEHFPELHPSTRRWSRGRLQQHVQGGSPHHLSSPSPCIEGPAQSRENGANQTALSNEEPSYYNPPAFAASASTH